jgi:hypothetical protein
MLAAVRWLLGLTVAVAVIGVPFTYYRSQYAHAKRLREVTAHAFYRCGQLTADGFTEAVERYHIRTIINLQNEAPDPLIPKTYWGGPKVRESELCERLGVRYVVLAPELIAHDKIPDERPSAIDEFLAVLDDPAAYPVLLHCKAGLHRTGLLTAIYRIEYEGWSTAAAVRELRANGFGDAACTTANEYLVQYLQYYKPRPKAAGARSNTAGGTP